MVLEGITQQTKLWTTDLHTREVCAVTVGNMTVDLCLFGVPRARRVHPCCFHRLTFYLPMVMGGREEGDCLPLTTVA